MLFAVVELFPALADYDKVISLNPKNFVAYYN
jgi:hypothetical protein